MQDDSVVKVQYVAYGDLQSPSAGTIAQGAIEVGFASQQWSIQFQTLTHLRQANKHYGSVFLNELLPINYKNILLQVDNLRSNNSKEALTLVSEIFEHQKIEIISNQIMRSLVAGMIVKSTSEKAFLRNEALSGLNFIPMKWNQGALEEFCSQTQATNGQISQLAIKLMAEMIKNNKKYESDGKFLKNLSHNLNGKRAVLQRRAKEILNNLKEREGEQKLEQKINTSNELLEEESNTLRLELKEKEVKPKGPSFKDFLKQKKEEI